MSTRDVTLPVVGHRPSVPHLFQNLRTLKPSWRRFLLRQVLQHLSLDQHTSASVGSHIRPPPPPLVAVTRASRCSSGLESSLIVSGADAAASTLTTDAGTSADGCRSAGYSAITSFTFVHTHRCSTLCNAFQAYFYSITPSGTSRAFCAFRIRPVALGLLRGDAHRWGYHGGVLHWDCMGVFPEYFRHLMNDEHRVADVGVQGPFHPPLERVPCIQRVASGTSPRRLHTS